MNFFMEPDGPRRHLTARLLFTLPCFIVQATSEIYEANLQRCAGVPPTPISSRWPPPSAPARPKGPPKLRRPARPPPRSPPPVPAAPRVPPPTSPPAPLLRRSSRRGPRTRNAGRREYS